MSEEDVYSEQYHHNAIYGESIVTSHICTAGKEQQLEDASGVL